MLTRDDPGEDGVPVGPPVAGDTGSAADGLWRTEYWRDLRVDVPDSWGWGGALPACGVGPSVSSGGQPVASDSGIPYVGRPISSTDSCPMEPSPPPAPYLWLGAHREVGVVDLGGGYVEETVEVNGSRLAVASDDEALRERILASATGGEDLHVRARHVRPVVPEDVGPAT